MNEPKFAMRTPLTADQFDDLWRAIHEWERIRRENRPEDRSPTTVDFYKSCLLGRLTMAGKDPLPFPPPTAYSAPWYSLIEKGRAFLHGDHETPYVYDEGVLIGQCRWGLVEAGDDTWVVEFPNWGQWRVRHLNADEAAERVTKGQRKNDRDLWEPEFYGEGDWIIERVEG